jgi:hypothetical protein
MFQIIDNRLGRPQVRVSKDLKTALNLTCQYGGACDENPRTSVESSVTHAPGNFARLVS